MPFLLALSVGCASGPYDAPVGAELTYMNGSEQGFVFDVNYNDPEDNIGLLIREQVMVTNQVAEVSSGATRELPLNNILVELTSGWSAAYIIPTTAVVMGHEDASCVGESDCNEWFDMGDGRYIEFTGEYGDLATMRPTYMSGGTNGRGLLEFYVFIDSIPYDDDGEVIPIPLYASIGVDTASWSYNFE